MHGKPSFAVFSMILAAFGGGCRQETLAPVVDVRVLTSEDRAEFEGILSGIGPRASLTLYEGLPHQNFEFDQMQKELESKQTVEIHGSQFYERPLDVREDDVATLHKLSLAPESYASYLGPKACGGFHPDYCLQWTDNGTILELLICQGCHEMALFGHGTELLVDVNNGAFRKFQDTLKEYRDQRPEPEY